MTRAAGLLAAALLWAAPARADADTAQPADKKAQLLAAKQEATAADAAVPEAERAAARAAWHETLDARIGKRPEPLVSIFNLWTHETLVFPARGEVTIEKEVVDRFLRCHATNEPTDMDPALFPVLVKAARKFGVDRVEIVSGFRAPKYNLSLRKKGRQVARNSQHTKGHAVDFRLPGIPIRRLHRWARSLRLGGVGFYPHSKFIHVDTADVRYWTGN